MVNRSDIISFINNYLAVAEFSDYCPNGLQVEGVQNIRRIITGVTACQALLDVAVAKQADLIVVHHGYFWKGDDSVVTGMLRKRLSTLLQHNINLAAYHLPLDVHPVIGNNALLAKQLNCVKESTVTAAGVPGLLNLGRLVTPMQAGDFKRHIANSLGRVPLHVGSEDDTIETVAWCTGAAQDCLSLAAANAVDAFVTGEVSERTVHMARECGVHFFAAGHHATEKAGVKALGELLAEEFQLECEFIDIPNPV